MGNLFRCYWIAWLVLAGVFASPGWVHAQTTQPGASGYVPGQSPTDTMPITTGEEGPRAVNPDGTLTGTTPRSIGFDLTRMAVALIIVLAMIFASRWMFGRFFAGSRAPVASRAVKVLGRTSLAPRQQVLLLQVGNRVVVVGESNGTLSTLAQIDDPDEVAQLIGQLQQEQISRAASFGGLFGRAEKKFEEEATPDEVDRPVSSAPPDEAEANARSELSGLMEKVRSIRNQLGKDQ